jgi:hypothetical protein
LLACAARVLSGLRKLLEVAPTSQHADVVLGARDRVRCLAGAETFFSNEVEMMFTTSDLLHIMPMRFARPYVAALRWSGNFTGVCCFGAAHWVYKPLARAIGESNINFIEAGTWQSTQDVLDPADRPQHDQLFLSILRHCPRRDCAADLNRPAPP